MISMESSALMMCFGSLLFGGLLINRKTLPPAVQWLHTISFFHAAFEALAVNELRYLQLKQNEVIGVSFLLFFGAV